MFNIGLYLNCFWHWAHLQILFMWKMWKNYRNRWKCYEPHAKTHIGEKHIIVQICPEVVFLQGGWACAFSSDIFNRLISHIGYIFTAPSKIYSCWYLFNFSCSFTEYYLGHVWWHQHHQQHWNTFVFVYNLCSYFLLWSQLSYTLSFEFIVFVSDSIWFSSSLSSLSLFKCVL